MGGGRSRSGASIAGVGGGALRATVRGGAGDLSRDVDIGSALAGTVDRVGRNRYRAEGLRTETGFTGRGRQIAVLRDRNLGEFRSLRAAVNAILRQARRVRREVPEAVANEFGS